MKKIITCLMLTSALTAVPIVFNTGCAVTQHRESAGNYAKDKEIIAKIKAKMYKDPVVKGTQVEVQCLNGEVQLSGFVDSEDAKQRAAEIAQSTTGVVGVHNNLLLPTGR
jgi:osmotically-inducible protein OsmY